MDPDFSLYEIANGLRQAVRQLGDPGRVRDLDRLMNGQSARPFTDPPEQLMRDLARHLRDKRHVSAAAALAFVGADRTLFGRVAGLGEEQAEAALTVGELIATRSPRELTDLVAEVCPGAWKDLAHLLPASSISEDVDEPVELPTLARRQIAMLWDDAIRLWPDLAVEMLRAEAEWVLGEPEVGGEADGLDDVPMLGTCDTAIGGGGAPEIDRDEDEVQQDLSDSFDAAADDALDDDEITSSVDGVPGIEPLDRPMGPAGFSDGAAEGEDGDVVQLGDVDAAGSNAGIDPSDLPPQLAAFVAREAPGSTSRISAVQLDSSFELLRVTFARPIPPRDWVVNPLFERGHTTLLVAPPATGKTTLLIHTALSVAAGMNWGGFVVRRPGRVLYINGEETPAETTRRFAAAATEMGLLGPFAPADDPLLRIRTWTQGGALRIAARGGDEGLALTKQGKLLIAMIKRLEPDLVTIDSLVLSHLLNESDNGEMSQFFDLLQTIALTFGCAIVVAHHTRKAVSGRSQESAADSSRGASSILASVRAGWLLQAPSASAELADRGGAVIEVASLKANNLAAPEAGAMFRRGSVRLDNGDDVGVLIPVASR